jgi:hypothetical protein
MLESQVGQDRHEKNRPPIPGSSMETGARQNSFMSQKRGICDGRAETGILRMNTIAVIVLSICIIILARPFKKTPPGAGKTKEGNNGVKMKDSTGDRDCQVRDKKTTGGKE